MQVQIVEIFLRADELTHRFFGSLISQSIAENDVGVGPVGAYGDRVSGNQWNVEEYRCASNYNCSAKN